MPEEPLRILCLADDLTGLAEVAGLVANGGIEGTLYPTPHTIPEEPDGQTKGKVCFVNLACRANPGPQADHSLKEFLGNVEIRKVRHAYLKVDSAARGPIGSLLRAFLESMDERNLPFLLTNPPQGRSVKGGRIFVGDLPLDKTDFGKDPIHPRWTSFLPDLICEEKLLSTVILKPFEVCETSGVHVLEGSTDREVEEWADLYSSWRSASGAAPFGVAMIRRWAARWVEKRGEFVPLPWNSVLAVVGTRHPAGDRLAHQFRSAGGTVVELGGDWKGKELPLLLRSPSQLGHPTEILETLTSAAVDMVSEFSPRTLFTVGGETAQSLATALDLTRMTSKRQIRSVSVLSAETRKGEPLTFLLKPGSFEADGLLETLFGLEPSIMKGNQPPRRTPGS